MGSQGIKDAFYLVLRGRVAAGNAERVISLRGQLRPAVLVAENELPVSEQPADAFVLHWRDVVRVEAGLLQLRCEVRYWTAGSAGGAGMDRGRALAAMDAELAAALNSPPQNAPGIFWSDVVPAACTETTGRLERVASVEVFGYER